MVATPYMVGGSERTALQLRTAFLAHAIMAVSCERVGIDRTPTTVMSMLRMQSAVPPSPRSARSREVTRTVSRMPKRGLRPLVPRLASATWDCTRALKMTDDFDMLRERSML